LGALDTILIIGVIAVIGYFAIQFLGGMSIGMSGGAGGLGLAPTTAGTVPAKESPDGTPLADAKYGFAPNSVCKARGSKTKDVKCKCETVGIVTIGVCDMPEGIVCPLNMTSTKATEDNLKDIGLQDCKMNGKKAELEIALGGTPPPPEEEEKKEEDEDDKESKYAVTRSFYSAASPLPPFTMRRSDGLAIAEVRGFRRRGRRPSYLFGGR
jgi:hypothetical protein